MSFPTTSVLDSFTRADETPIGGNWTGPLFSGENSLNLSSNTLTAPGGGGNAYWNASTFGPDCEVYVTIAILPSNANFIQLFARTTGHPANPQAYMARLIIAAPGTETVRLFRRVSGSAVQLGADITGLNFAAGDKFGLECLGDQISAYQFTGGSWSLLGTRTDSNITGAGAIAVELVTDGALDDFGGGSQTTGFDYSRFPKGIFRSRGGG